MKITVYNKLKKFDSWLTTANKGNYIRSLTNKQVDELIEIGNEIGIIYKNNHCPKCILDFVKKLSIPYFEQKQKLEDKKNQKEGQEDEKQ